MLKEEDKSMKIFAEIIQIMKLKCSLEKKPLHIDDELVMDAGEKTRVHDSVLQGNIEHLWR